MSSGHASHKGSSIKPNVNANGLINDPEQDIPQDYQPEEGVPIPGRTKEIRENREATERPSDDVREAPEAG